MLLLTATQKAPRTCSEVCTTAAGSRIWTVRLASGHIEETDLRQRKRFDKGTSYTKLLTKCDADHPYIHAA